MHGVKRIFSVLFFVVSTSLLAQGQAWYSQAEKAFRQGNYDSAYFLNSKALAQFKSSASADSLVYSYVQRTTILWNLSGIQEALQMADSAILVSEKYPSGKLSKVSALNKKGQLLVHAYYLEEAKKTFQKAESWIGEGDKDSPIVSGLYNNISWLYLNLQQLPEAYDYALRSLDIQKGLYGENDRRLMGVYQSLGLIANDMANYVDAERYSYRLFDIAKLHLAPDHPTMALVYNQLAIIKEARFEYTEALRYMREVARVAELNYADTGNPQFLAIAYNNIGNLYHQLHEFSLAEPYFEKALQLHTENYGTEEIGIIQSLAHLASTKLALEKLTEADSLFQLAYSKQQVLEKENLPGLASLESQIGDLYSAQSNLQEAVKWYEKAVGHFQRSDIEEHYLVSEAKTSLAKGLLGLGQFEQAIRYHEESLDNYRKLYPDSKVAVASKLNELGNSFLRKGDLEKGLSYSDSTFLEILGAGGYAQSDWLLQLPPNAKIADFIFTKIELLAAQNSQQAKKDYLLQILELTKGYTYNFERSIVGLRSQFSLVELAKKQRQIIQKAIDACWDLANVYGEQEYLEEAFFLSELQKGVLLRLAANNMMVDAKADSGDKILARDRGWRERISRLNSEYLNSKESNDSVLNALTQSLEDYRDFQDSVTRVDQDRWRDRYALTPFSLAEIRDRLLGADEALLEYSLSGESIYGFLLTHGDFRVFRRPRAPLEHAISSLQNLPKLDLAEFKAAAFPLFQSLVQPVYQYLEGKSLIIVPDRELFSVNFETLISDGQGKAFSELSYLLRTHQVSYLLSASTSNRFFERDRSPANKGLFMAPGFTEEMKTGYLADLDGDVAFPIQSQLIRQPFSLKTAERASELIGGTFFQQNEAQESFFTQSAPDFGILHLATHGEADHSFPMQSRLFFALPADRDSSMEDGVLHAYEIYGLQLNAELAVLSACNTGVGKFQEGEGLVSLAHSFLHAGCSAVLMSMWAIDEKTSSEILESFYLKLAKGEPKAAALREAKLDFLENAPEELAHPYYWAGLGLIGDTSALDSQGGKPWLHWALAVALLVGLLFWWMKKR
ncbi:CHAT domain-containing protein [Algoriphagus sp. H41]|uniref:CHAT domain-containing protein n=1 Tax=Algoriphagus oliviformis TaxID=2811231 RepID=A0ABS3C407_9BACT|nr:CHAT domain-containing tetratricopeptide repeat protein [Algoriphagus oliviformis]MBN7810886.1 CHAT domain-containing protein [Algoriphagus oliviformis]